ncbi:hypothetical protein MMC24_003878 [Lignoscripta atroalba]|nr:hypothetical protein [Lignoscripta atroalba]
MTRGATAKELSFLATMEKEGAPQQLSSPPNTPAPAMKQVPSGKKVANGKATPKSKKASANAAPITPASTGKKRKRAATVKVEEDLDELPHGLGRPRVAKPVDSTNEIKDKNERPPKKRSTSKDSDIKEDVKDITGDVHAATDAIATLEESPSKVARKAKVNPYGVTLGVSPYPEWAPPTPEECQEVNDILSKTHGKIEPPADIPVPSLTVAGCGEVPCILEALLRTLISAHTSSANAGRAIRGAIQRFGTLKHGVAAGSLDWNAVRLTPEEELSKAIMQGGMHKKKAKFIKQILDEVYIENLARRAELLSNNAKSAFNPPSTGKEADIMKAAAIALADENVLSLDYMHLFTPTEAFTKFLEYPGIGIKTASCTLLFCMQHPSYAVDTHVWRLSKWLGWVPGTANRDQTFAHCDVRVPDELKYSLHQLLIKHGKVCPRCRANTGEGSAKWEDGCAIEHLVTRTGARKGGEAEVKIGKKKKAKGDEEEEGVKQNEENGEEQDVKIEKKKTKGKNVEAMMKGGKETAKAGAKGKATTVKNPSDVNGKRVVSSDDEGSEVEDEVVEDTESSYEE